MAQHILSRIQSPGPKRILALDGGGIRGAVTIGFLKKIERILRERHGNPALVLSDYFGPRRRHQHRCDHRHAPGLGKTHRGD
jgi:hypothetical protein